jgi:hypothetical protein
VTIHFSARKEGAPKPFQDVPLTERGNYHVLVALQALMVKTLLTMGEWGQERSRRASGAKGEG